MMPTALIAFREFLEVFLIIGIFLGISRQMSLKREKEILFAGVFGISISLVVPIIFFLLGDRARIILTQKNSDILEGYLLIISGIFISYVAITLHNFLSSGKHAALKKAYDRFSNFGFDLALFFTIFFFILREEFEIAIFTSTISLFSSFLTNMLGLLVGLLLALPVGLLTFLSYVKLAIKKVFKITELLLVLTGASITMNGISILLIVYFRIHLEKIFSLPLKFLPDDENVFGHLLKTMTGLQREFSLIQLSIMAAYIFIFFLILKRFRQA